MLRLLPILLALVVGCGRSCGDAAERTPDRGAGPAGELVVQSDLPALEQQALRELLAEAHPRLQPSFVPPSADRAVDLVLLRGPSTVEADAGLAPLPAELLSSLPQGVRSPDGRYVAIDRRAQVLVVGRLMANVPTGILDVAEPRFAGRLARPSGKDEALILLLTSTLADRGAPVAQRVLEGLVANEGEPPQVHDSGGALQALLTRSVDLAMTDHVAARRAALGAQPPRSADGVLQALSEARFVTVFPDAADGGVAWGGTILTRPAAAPHPAAADAVIRWLLGAAGQSAWSTATGAYPVRPDAARAPGLRSEDSFGWSRTSLAERASLRAEVTELLTASRLP